MRIPLIKHVACLLIIVMFVIGIVPRVDAGLVPSELIAISQTDRTADLEKIQKVIEMKMVSDRLEKYGLTQDEIQNRLGNLSDQQIHNLALQIDDLKVGQDSGLGIVIAILIIILLVVLIIHFTGHRVVVTK